jgi:hypothetical protein
MPSWHQAPCVVARPNTAEVCLCGGDGTCGRLAGMTMSHGDHSTQPSSHSHDTAMALCGAVAGESLRRVVGDEGDGGGAEDSLAGAPVMVAVAVAVAVAAGDDVVAIHQQLQQQYHHRHRQVSPVHRRRFAPEPLRIPPLVAQSAVLHAVGSRSVIRPRLPCKLLVCCPTNRQRVSMCQMLLLLLLLLLRWRQIHCGAIRFLQLVFRSLVV